VRAIDTYVALRSPSEEKKKKWYVHSRTYEEYFTAFPFYVHFHSNDEVGSVPYLSYPLTIHLDRP